MISVKRWKPRRGGFKGKLLEVTPARVPISVGFLAKESRTI
jgi:hypothetical protein